MKRITWVYFLVILFAGCNSTNQVKWVSTTKGSPWTQQQSISFDVYDDTTIVDLTIYTDSVKQIIDGFGGCFNELGWEALSVLTPEQKNEVIKSLFDQVDGCKFNICRMSIGANDYAVDWYSLNETSNDFEMNHFSIERDQDRLIPYIHAAQKFNPYLKIWASPWCPPSWMKTNNHYACRPDVVNDLIAEGEGKEMVTQFRMEPKYLEAYALYFSKFIQAYKNEDISIYSIHVQNEPNSCQNFPSCIWKPSDLATFIGNYLGSKFSQDKLETEIWLGTVERPQIERVDTILTHPEAKKYVKGVGFQWGGKGAIPKVNKKYPSYKLMQTENECGDGRNSWETAEYTFSLLNHYFKNGTNSYLFWNMVLEETGKSRWGWKQNALVTIHSKTKEIIYNPEFYVMKHFSYFVKPGSKRLQVEGIDNCLAFIYENEVTIVLNNTEKQSEELKIKIGDKVLKIVAEPRSFNTLQVNI